MFINVRFGFAFISLHGIVLIQFGLLGISASIGSHRRFKFIHAKLKNGLQDRFAPFRRGRASCIEYVCTLVSFSYDYITLSLIPDMSF